MKKSKLVAGAASLAAVGPLQWRLINLYFHTFGNIPMGQQLVQSTLMALHERGWHPTVGQLGRIIDLPQSTVSRHVNMIIQSGLIREEIDPSDRRKRVLCATDKGNRIRKSLFDAINALNLRVASLAQNGPAPSEKAVDSLEDALKVTEVASKNPTKIGGARE